MSKRFTDTEKWDQQWLKKLKPEYKLIWVVLESLVDHAGLWKVDITKLMDKTGLDSIDLYDFIETCNKDYDKFTGEEITRERLKIVNESHLWMTGFIEFQYSSKSGDLPNNSVVKSAISILESFNIADEATLKGFLTLPKGSKGLDKGIERDKDKDKDNNKKKGVESDQSDNQTCYDFDEFWDDYDIKKDRAKSEKKYKRLSEKDRAKIRDFIPIYQVHQPNPKYRKNPTTFLNSKIWLDDWKAYPPKQLKPRDEEFHFDRDYANQFYEAEAG